MTADFLADYIIVGAGSAGCVLANRLSDDPSVKVLLIESGPPGGGIKTSMPAGSFMLMGDPKYDWNYVGEPDASLNGRQISWSGGKMLGGSSTINGMVYFRGARSDFDGWAAQGCAGWGFDEVFPYFLRSENFAGPPSQTHGRTGPLGVSPGRVVQEMAEPFRLACAERGMALRTEYCDGAIDGAFLVYGTTTDGRRSSTARAFLEPVRHRPNLRIVTDCTIDRLLFEGRRAVGVRASQGSEAIDYRATAEIIVSAGAIGSPTLLLRSGIGPGEDLAGLGIDVVADLPGVGGNFHDHVAVNISKQVDSTTFNVGMGPFGIVRHALEYLLFRRGRLASIAVHAMAYPKSDPALAEPDIAISMLPLAIDMSGHKPQLRKKGGITLGFHPTQPKGRGRIRLRDAILGSRPAIAHQLLGDERDLNLMVKGCAIAQSIFEAPPLADRVVAAYDPDTIPTTREGWIDFLRERASIGYHPVGTCRMGPGNDAVVDSRLSVHGVGGLRVIDASIMPNITSGNTNAPTIMIAEKGAEMIREAARQSAAFRSAPRYLASGSATSTVTL